MFQATRNRRLFGNKCLDSSSCGNNEASMTKESVPRPEKSQRYYGWRSCLESDWPLKWNVFTNFQSPCFSAFNSFSAQCTVSMTLKPTVGELIILLQGKRFLYNAFLLRGLKAILPHSHEFFLSSVSYSDASIGVSWPTIFGMQTLASTRGSNHQTSN